MAKKSTKTPAAPAAKKKAAAAAPAAAAPPAPPVPPPVAPPVPPPAGEAAPPAPPVAAPAPAPAAPAEKPPREKQPEQNGVTRPASGSTRQVWDMADRISADAKTPAKRADVVAACIAVGVNASTATTQFGRWAKFHGYTGEAAPGRAPKAAAAAPVAPPAAPPAAAPAASANPAFTAGAQAYIDACAGKPAVNPYTADTPEANSFSEGWAAQAAATAAK